MSRQIKSGAGWRIGWDADADTYQGLVGGDRWSVELTQAELDDFCYLLSKLDAQVQAIAQELMDQETITCEVETERLWLEAAGYPSAYDVAMIITTGRQAEGFWPAAAVPHLLHAAQTLRVF